ncbi:MAG: hypothetical protein ACQER4_02170 [Bacteroidota bacterium]
MSVTADEMDGIAYAKWEEEKAFENCQAQAEKETSKEPTQEEVGLGGRMHLPLVSNIRAGSPSPTTARQRPRQ